MYLSDRQKLHRIYSGLVTFQRRSWRLGRVLQDILHGTGGLRAVSPALCLNPEPDRSWEGLQLKQKFLCVAEESKQASFASSGVWEKHLQLDIDYPLTTARAQTKETTHVSEEERKQSLSEKW